mmetsp:Transcript_24807/g.39706  ORF Transcript_24807/g.39706 Transcript_24807/m.39706 type:complete len:141 (+) Transcript_24807:1185-1607(+)
MLRPSSEDTDSPFRRFFQPWLRLRARALILKVGDRPLWFPPTKSRANDFLWDLRCEDEDEEAELGGADGGAAGGGRGVLMYKIDADEDVRPVDDMCREFGVAEARNNGEPEDWGVRGGDAIGMRGDCSGDAVADDREGAR